jgi:anthranilate synthase component 1
LGAQTPQPPPTAPHKPAPPLPAPDDPAFAAFADLATRGNLVPVYDRLLTDALTPVLAYRCLVAPDDRDAPSFLFESVVGGDAAGRYSFVGARPALELVATRGEVATVDNVRGTRTVSAVADPLAEAEAVSKSWRPVLPPGLPNVFSGGFVGYVGYDTVRYVYAGKLPFSSAPPDTDGLPDMHLALYNDVVVFDGASKLAYCVAWVHVEEFESVAHAYADGAARLAALTDRLAAAGSVGGPSLPTARVGLATAAKPAAAASNMSKDEFLGAVATVQGHIAAGDVFQLVLSQRFERRTYADPFEIYRALRVVNPSPYMIYLQARGAILVASSPEILCRVGADRTVTNRPLAGTRPRGASDEADAAAEAELLADDKERAEHVMLVDLGRNDVGRVCDHGSVSVDALMQVERYSHVMHISSTVTGLLRPELTAWDALRAALPAGTVSGAPKVRAMQIIDQLEAAKRGPYGGGVGHLAFAGGLDMALALRTMVVPTAVKDGAYSYAGGDRPRREWTVYIQAGAGIVADSVPAAEFEETVNKAAALGRAVDLAEAAFVGVVRDG